MSEVSEAAKRIAKSLIGRTITGVDLAMGGHTEPYMIQLHLDDGTCVFCEASYEAELTIQAGPRYHTSHKVWVNL